MVTETGKRGVVLDTRGPISAASLDASAFEAMAADHMAGLLVLADATFWTHRKSLGELCLKSRLPSIWVD